MTAAQADTSGYLGKKTAIIVFLAFAAAYFCSALVRAITATLSPVLTQEFSLQARDLGLLAGGYFLGFAAMQLPLGAWLDRHGPKRVILWFLGVSVLGSLAFSMATSFSGLLASRVVLGAGVSACLMAPLTGYRRWLEPAALLRANSWMLMTASLGMLASTLPVQWLMPLTGWRALFWILAGLIVLSMLCIAWVVPHWNIAPTLRKPDSDRPKPVEGAPPGRYADVLRNRYFQKMTPLAFFNYGGLVAVQTLWAGPWMLRVAGYTPLESATGLFYINATMLVTFWTWGMVNPWLVRHGWHATRLVAWGVPLSIAVLAVNIAMGAATGWFGWALFCMSCSAMSLAQPAVGMAFHASLAGRALSAYNLVIFSGVFVVQWGIGLLIDAFKAAGLAEVASFQAAFGVFLCCCIASYAYFLSVNADNSPQ
ncbi:MFS transporter [Polaromonas sp.]|uniref:MFS transporter n=1 Tax=Polaromonas sp. TaxID=1869339 RepID=UPI003752F3FA